LTLQNYPCGDKFRLQVLGCSVWKFAKIATGREQKLEIVPYAHDDREFP
jgi:hypothetical protein